MDNREEPLVAQVRQPTRTWSPVLEVDGMPIAYDATLRHYCEGHAGLVVEALEQPLLLPQDMEVYRTFNHPELFLSLKRDLAMVSDSVHFSSFILISLHFIAKVIFFFLLSRSYSKFLWPFIVGAIFASRPSVALVVFFGLESHIGKTHFLFLPYKA